MKTHITRGSGRVRRTAAAVAVAATSIVGGLALAELPASAACATTYADSNGNNQNRHFAISSSSTCNDMNFRQSTYGQSYRGEYRSGSSFIPGSAGWVYRSPSTTNLRVVISGVADTTVVRATGASVNAHIYVVH